MVKTLTGLGWTGKFQPRHAMHARGSEAERLDLNGSVDSDAVFNFLLHCRKIETVSKSSGAVLFVSRLRWIWSSELQFSCGWSLHCVFWYGWSLVWSFGHFAWSKLICCRWVQMGFFLPICLAGQNNFSRSCSVIWSTVGVVCPAWSSGVDKVYLSQYFDRLFAYSSLGCFEMLSSRRSIFHCYSWDQVEELNFAVDWLVCYFIHFNRCREAGFEWFCRFWCCFQFSIALLENWK